MLNIPNQLPPRTVTLPEKRRNRTAQWTVPYSDLITLLFALFTAMYAMSSLDVQKMQALLTSTQEAFGAPAQPPATTATATTTTPALAGTGNDTSGRAPAVDMRPTIASRKTLEQTAQRLRALIASQNAESLVHLRWERRGLVVGLAASGFFAPNATILKTARTRLLDAILLELRQTPFQLSFEGHTDGDPRYNPFSGNANAPPIQNETTKVRADLWELSTKRATTIAAYALEEHTYAPQRISVAGYASYRPLASNSTAGGRYRNRRVDIVLETLTAHE